MATRDLLVRINGDTKGLQKALDDGDGKGKKFAGAFAAIGKVAKVAAIGVGVAAGAATIFGKQSVDAFNASTEASTKLRTNMLNVKGATEANVASLEKLASKLQGVGVIEDDVIKAGMSQLATFNLQSSTIAKLTPKISDMVAQLKGHNATAEDMVAINNLVGKVMTGNVGSLSRYGVTLDDNQKKLLKQGNEAERAAVLNQVLAQNYGKVNEALRNTPQGQLTALKNTWGDFQELVGEFVSKMVTPLVGGMNNWFQSMGGPEGVLEAITTNMNKFQEAAWPVISAIRDYLEPKFVALWHSVEQLLPTFQRLWGEVLAPLAKNLGVVLVVALGLTVDAINLLFKALKPVIEWMLNNKGTVIALAAAFGILALAMKFNSIAAGFNAAMSSTITKMVAAKASASSLATFLTTTGAGAFGVIAAAAIIAGIKIVEAGNKAKAAWGQAQQAINSAGKSDDAVISRLRELQRSGTPEQRARAKATLRKLAESGAFARGTNFAPGGVALVGEEGPELVNLPRGAQVFSSPRTKQMLSNTATTLDGPTEAPQQSAGVNIYFNPTLQVGMFAGMPTEYREIAERMWVEFTRIAKSNGVNLQTIGVRGQ